MNIKLLKIRKFERYLYAGILTLVMFLSAQFTGHREIIFPEILAILTGAWIAKRQPWNTDKFRIWLSPPVVVTFAELSNTMSPNRKRLFKIWEVMVIGALIGTAFRFLLNIYSGFPLFIAAIFACLFMFLIFNKTKILYPPSAGALLMPMILKPHDVIYYPFQAAIGLGILILLVKFLFTQK